MDQTAIFPLPNEEKSTCCVDESIIDVASAPVNDGASNQQKERSTSALCFTDSIEAKSAFDHRMDTSRLCPLVPGIPAHGAVPGEADR
jgi:hypothetical protein